MTQKEAVKASKETTGLDRPSEYYMPEGYDFSNKFALPWTSYGQYFRLRTDAVWEKHKLMDWFRSFYKRFYFNPLRHMYETVYSEEPYIFFREPETIEESDIAPFIGYSSTGVTTSFQPQLAQRDKVSTSFQQYFSMSDYYLLCSLRFEKWSRCEQSISGTPLEDRYMDYPCYEEYYETNYACSDDMIEHLLELHYVREANDIVGDNYKSGELQKPPNMFDSPQREQRRTYTY